MRAAALGGRDLPRSLLAATGLLAFGFWIAWNATWLSSGSLPPSILKFFTGLPVPTTGFSRSLKAAAGGRFEESLWWNPFTAAFVALLAASAVALLLAARRREPMVLPPLLARAWPACLAAAWIVKAIQGPAWW